MKLLIAECRDITDPERFALCDILKERGLDPVLYVNGRVKSRKAKDEKKDHKTQVETAKDEGFTHVWFISKDGDGNLHHQVAKASWDTVKKTKADPATWTG